MQHPRSMKEKVYTQHSPLEYYEMGKDGLYDPSGNAGRFWSICFKMLDKKGEEKTFAYMRKYMVGRKKLSKDKLEHKRQEELPEKMNRFGRTDYEIRISGYDYRWNLLGWRASEHIAAAAGTGQRLWNGTVA